MEARVDCQMPLILLLWYKHTHLTTDITLDNTHSPVKPTAANVTTHINKPQGCELQWFYCALHLIETSIYCIYNL